jgi:HK97 family phage prohead protease
VKADGSEVRTVDVDVQDLDTRGRTVTGFAAVYGAEAQLDGFTETIQHGAFADVLDGDVRCLLNHDPNIVLGRTKSGTLRLADDPRGLRFEVDMPESRSDLREAVARGDLDGASFRFQVAEDRWDGDRRTITRIGELRDITLATYPAYPATSIELRTRPNTEATQKAQAAVEDQTQNEERTEQAPPAGSLRVEERVEAPRLQTLAQASRSAASRPARRRSPGTSSDH